ncbi:MAG: C10 family peptidase [Bacteroidaceae bacterium]|nr:C10 family peptidase [Bacteroidaceae bacterium]
MKRTGIIFALMWLTIGTWAQQLTEQQALDRALQYLNGTTIKARYKVENGGRKMTAAKVDAKKIYAFNREGGGFVIASADERTLPVLGYSDSGSIDWERMPENMRAWLVQYDEAIATLGDRTCFKDGNLLDVEGKAMASIRMSHPAIEPLIKTRWAQEMSPYYDMCPLYAGHNPDWQGQRCYAGCTAAALAQVLNYWQWPKALPDGLPAYESIDDMYDENLSWHIDALPPVTFDWENMLDEYINPDNPKEIYGTEEEQQAVATLMRYCGQAIKSDYSPKGTGNYISPCRDVLVNHFGYAAATYLSDRREFGIDEWEEMVYTELAAGRPVIYGGVSPTYGGHAFVCDGYDGDGLFHTCMGAQGLYDGYYSLSVLNPFVSTNPNKGSIGLGLTQWQDMIIGLDPSLKEMKIPHSEIPELLQYQRMGVLSEDSVILYFQYNHDDAGTATADYALGTIEVDGTLTPRFFGDANDSIINYLNEKVVEIDSTAFQPGETLKLYPMLRFRHLPDAEWQLIPPLTRYADAGRTEEGSFFITIYPYMLEYVDATITAGLGQIGASSDLTVTLRNPNDQDYVGLVMLESQYYGYINAEDITEDTPYTEGDIQWIVAYLRAGQEGEVMFQINPMQGGLIRFVLKHENGKSDQIYLLYEFDSFTMVFDPTAIKGVGDMKSANDDAIYDLQGRRVSAKEKGLYIRQGKKYMKR